MSHQTDENSSSDIEPQEIGTSDDENDEPEEEDVDLESNDCEEEFVTEDTVKIGRFSIPWTSEDVEPRPQKNFRPADGITMNIDRFRNFGFFQQESLIFFLFIFPLKFWAQVVVNSNAYAKSLNASNFSPIQNWQER
jgi:hypothetical protein